MTDIEKGIVLSSITLGWNIILLILLISIMWSLFGWSSNSNYR